MIGIYKITNTVNGKVYIGQSWDINKRWIQHSRHEHNSHLKSAFNKYGIVNFDFEVVKEIHETPLTQLLLNAYEKLYIEKFKSYNPVFGYNKSLGGIGGIPTDETRAKYSIVHKGRHHTNETKLKIKLANIAAVTNEKRIKQSKRRLGVKTSIETKTKISNSKKGSPAYNKGIPQSIYAKTRQRCSWLGYIVTFE